MDSGARAKVSARLEMHVGEIGEAPAGSFVLDFFDENLACPPDLACEMRGEGLVRGFAQARGTVFDDVPRKLWHPRCGGALARGEGEDMDVSETAVFDQPEGAIEHLLGLGGKPSNQVSAERHLASGVAQAGAKIHGVAPAMTALHPLEDHVITGLQREMGIGRDTL